MYKDMINALAIVLASSIVYYGAVVVADKVIKKVKSK